MTIVDRSVATEPSVPGRTTVTERALHRLAICLARDVARVSHSDVSVTLSDTAGELKVTVNVPVALGLASAGSIADRGAELRRSVIEGMRDMAGRTVGAVDVRYSGIEYVTEARVR